MNKFHEEERANQVHPRAASIKAAQRAWLDVHRLNVEGVAREMKLDPATLRRYLSDTYPGVLPCDQIHGWYVASLGDLSPVRQQVHLCGFELQPLEARFPDHADTPHLASDLSKQSGDAVALLIDQWADGDRSVEERREALPMLRRLRAKLDAIINADEKATRGRR